MKSKSASIVGVIVLFTMLVSLFMLLNFNKKTNEMNKGKSYEVEQYEYFKENTKAELLGMSVENKSTEEVMNEAIEVVKQNYEKYDDGINVDVVSNQLIITIQINLDNGLKPEELIKKLTDILDNPLPEIELGSGLKPNSGNKVEQFDNQIRSNTACNTSGVDSKFCVSKLNAKVYVADKNSSNWAVLLHGFMMNGKQMYNAVGKMYTSKGINVIAVDLRGFGKSDGKVAMGYLESLDAYDWIKDLNENWKMRYKVNVEPKNIVVHGISLGGATTLQLATNPDIAKKNTNKGPYTANLTELNVKAFVDDCGYTSMSEIITGSLSSGSSVNFNSILSKLGVDKNSATKLLYEGTKENNSNNKLDEVLEGKGFIDFVEKFKDNTNLKPILPSIKDGFNLKPQRNDFNNNTVKFTGKTNLLDKLVRKLIMDLVGVGLTEETYDEYSNVFSAGRKFPEGSKVLIIHGTNDTTVPHNNADIVANNVAPGKLLYKWDVKGAPHAFVIIGKDKDKYKNLINNFTDCVNNNMCSKFDNSNEVFN